ncbi:MAG: hypothetical protein IKQ91_05410 [Oscillospiraceae bacterium]|nr:hypothetical protein [Oscillospiraceae bacterium]
MKNVTLRKIAQTGFTAAVCILLAVPGIATVMQNTGAQSETENAENRALTAFPSLKTEDGAWNQNYTMEIEAWFRDHFGFRTQMVTQYNALNDSIFHVSSNPDVIIGKEGWLYYSPTVSDAVGVPTLSGDAIRQAAHNLQMMSDYAASKGAKLIFAAAPNKASIYPEYLPARYLHTGGKNNLDLLRDALAETDVTVCNWRGMLLDEAKKGTTQLYHKLDTHWNNDGAMRGYAMLMASAGLDSRGWQNATRTETQDWTGDLWQMLYPDKENPDANAVYDIPQTWQDIGHMRSIDDLTIQTHCSDGEGKLLMFRDSFGRALIPLLSERFADCTYCRATAVPLEKLEASPADLVVYELVERNLDQLVKVAPKMPAPEAELPENVKESDAALPVLKMEEEGNSLHCFGLYDAAFSGADAVYLTTADGRTFEAFCCCEQEVLELPEYSENGFSAYLSGVSADTSITVTIRKNGEYIRF